MKKIIIIMLIAAAVLVIAFFTIITPSSSNRQNAINEKLSLESFAGKWYINRSTFPMWLKGDKTSPTFNYSLETKDCIHGLHGDVQYMKKGKLKHIEGFDKPTNEYNTAFLWRGNGILRLFKSKWEIIAREPAGKWAIMHFEKTAFTPEGYDLFSRQKELDETSMIHVNKKLAELGIEGKLLPIKQE